MMLADGNGDYVKALGLEMDGTEVVHDFRVYNRGTGELIIEKVQTG